MFHVEHYKGIAKSYEGRAPPLERGVSRMSGLGSTCGYAIRLILKDWGVSPRFAAGQGT